MLFSNFTFPRLEGRSTFTYLNIVRIFRNFPSGLARFTALTLVSYLEHLSNISSLMKFFIPKYSEIEKGLNLYIMRRWTDFAKFG